MSDWEEYDEYRYPRRVRRSTRAPPVSGDTIIRAPRRRERRPNRRLPCYCLDRCHHMDIGTTPMFRPFAWDPELDDYHLADLDHETSRDDFKVEVIKTEERTFRRPGSIARYVSSQASSFRKNGHTYYRLRHGDEYAVRIVNNTSEHVNALLKIDSDTMGKWRIEPYQSITIERPSHNPRRFTFAKEASNEARQGGVRQGSDSEANGLVEVTFIPMIDRRPDSMRWGALPLTNTLGAKSYGGESRSALTNSRGLEAQYAMNSVTESDSFGEQSARSSYEAGATVLGEDSSQKFGQASRYFVESKDRKIIKRVRIVIDSRSKYASIRDRDDGDDDSKYADPVPPKFMSYIN